MVNIKITYKPTTRIPTATLHGPTFGIPLLWFEQPLGGFLRAGVTAEQMHGIGVTLRDWLDLEVRWTDGTPQRLPFRGILKSTQERGTGPGLKMDEHEIVLLVR